MFHIICLETGEPVTCDLGLPMVWADGPGAAQIALEYSARTGKKHQPRPVRSDEWKAREQGRFDRGEYIRLPWADADWWRGSIGEREHFAHVSTVKDGMIAFTEDATKGAADRQTRVKPGTYLTRYYDAVLGCNAIKALAEEFAGKYEEHILRFAKTPDEIEHVYVNGPNSCMSSPAEEYAAGIHPTRIYGAGDLAIAYLEDGDRVTARALCWPENRIYGRVYGDEHRLCAALERAGYHQTERYLCGAKLLRIQCDHGLVAPYIDGCPGIEDCGDHLRIGGDLRSDSTRGVIDEERGEYCPHCDEYTEQNFTYIYGVDEAWCYSCTRDDTVSTEPHGRYYPSGDDGIVAMANGENWEQAYYDRNGGFCEATEEHYHADDLIYVEDVEQMWCLDYHREHGFSCIQCTQAFSNDARGARHDCCEACSGEVPLRDKRSRARQGRDEHPEQAEIPLELDMPF